MPRPAYYRSHDPLEDSPKAHGRPRKRLCSKTSPSSILPEFTLQSDKEPAVARRPNNQLSAGCQPDRDPHNEAQTALYADNTEYQQRDDETVNNLVVDDEVDSLEERRRKILRKIDWVGANIQHPIKLRFVATGNDGRLGKRRKITARHQNQVGAIAQSMVTSPFLKARLQRRIQDLSKAQTSNIGINTEGLPKNHVRISIGGRQIVAGVGSRTSQSKSLRNHLFSSQASASDVMLLDGEDLNRQPLQERREQLSYPEFSPALLVIENGSLIPSSPRSLPIRTPHRKQILPPYDKSSEAVDRLCAAIPDDLEGRILTSWTDQDKSALNMSLQFEDNTNDFCGPIDQPMPFPANSHPNLATLRAAGVEKFPGLTKKKSAEANQIPSRGTNPEISSPLTGYITDISKQLSLSARKLQSIARDKSRRIAYIGSHPEILHPKPLTLRTSQVLRSISSEPAGSTVAQIGAAEPIATTSQMLDEEIWKTWVLSSENDDITEESRIEEEPTVSISPGISNYEHQSPQKNSKQQEENDNKDLSDCQDTSRDINNYNQPMRKLRVGGHAEVGGQDIRTGTKQTHRTSINNEQILSKEKVLDYKNLFLLRPKKILSPASISVRVENPDEAWMKFILSEDEVDNEEEILKNLDQRNAIPPAAIQSVPESSLIAHPSTETTLSTQPHFDTLSVTDSIITPGNIGQDTTASSAEDHRTSNHTTQGSIPLSDPFVHNPTSTQPQSESHPASSSASRRASRRLTFTKPPRFAAHTHGDSSDAVAAPIKSPIHIRKGFLKRRRDRLAGKRRSIERGQKRDIYSLDSEDDVESIEDD